MRKLKQFYCALCVASIATMSMPLVAFSHGYEHRHHYEGSMNHYDESQNLTQTEFFSQSERDLVARVRDHLVTDPVLAPMERNLAVDAEVGTITLHGSLPTQAEKDQAIAVTERVLGVERVKDEIRVTNTASAVSPTAPLQPPTQARDSNTTESSMIEQRTSIASAQRRSSTSFPPTGHRGLSAVDDPSLPGSGQMAEEDRTGTSGPSGIRSTSPTSTGAIDTLGRMAKPAGDYAVTEVDRGLASQIRIALEGHPYLPVTENNVHLVVDNGYVTLQGWVPTEQDRLAIAERVKELNGVQSINNQLRIRSNADYQSGR